MLHRLCEPPSRFWFEPKRTTCCMPFYVPMLCGWLNRMWGNDVFMRYMQTGEFDWRPMPW